MYRFYTSDANPHGTPKPCEIAHENDHKRENNEFLVITLKHVSGLMVVVNVTGTPKTMRNNS